MDFFTAFLNVLAIIAIIGVGAFLVIFMSDLVISIVDGKNSMFFGRKKDKSIESDKVEKNLLAKNEEKLIENKVEEDKFLEFKEEPVKEEYKVDYDAAAKEEQLFLRKRNDVDYFKSPMQEKQEVEEENNEEDEYDDFIKHANKKALELVEAEKPVKKLISPAKFNYFNFLDDGSEDEEKVENDLNEIEEENQNETVVEEKQQVEETIVPTIVEKVDPTTTEEYLKLVEEIDQMRKVLQEEKEKTLLTEQELEQLKQAQKQEKINTVESAPAQTLEELETRLLLLEDRLKLNEKDLKANKKEFIPLRRIKKNLEQDELKLRRREAIVAKQKIVLFGVNNYVYDEEKEKKLAEELDLLDGLRLSVQHCEDVMNSNKDRYPVLEKTYNILTRTNEQLKADIEEVNKKIEMLKNKKD